VPPCTVDKTTSPTYQKLINNLKKQFPNVENDVDGILSDIAVDFRKAHHARSLPRFNDTLFKYRAPCSDQRRGSSGGFRVCGYYDKSKNTLYLILVWPKSEAEDLDYEVKKKAVKELLEFLAT
jgi:mRNA-degrading endonuclease RelE of RelBE toxin-antitoxin system